MTRRLILVLHVVLFWVARCPAGDSLYVGMQAPDFTLPFASKDTILHAGIQLSKVLHNGPVLLAFYPADWSGGCTREMCALRDNFSELATLGVTVLGISGDYVYSHREWARHLALPFGLLSDHSHQAARLYQSYNEQSGFNRRTVFVIDTLGVIAYVDRNYVVASDSSFRSVERAIRAMQAGRR